MEIQKEKPEFNETIKLVEAVLERLTFHAFEEVLIWSNEHASRALNLCLKKTLKEFESGDLIQTSGYPTLKHFSVDSVVKALSTALDQAQDYQCNLNKEIDRLENQLSKAQVPEGFVLVPQASLKVALSWMDEDIDPWQMGADSFADLHEHKPILETALVEAQEQGQ